MKKQTNTKKKKEEKETKKDMQLDFKELPVNIEEYFEEKDSNKEVLVSKELFTADNNVDIKTDLSKEEIPLINKLMWFSDFLEEHGLVRLYDDFLIRYMRLKISLDRKSRAEFVNMNKGDNTEEISKTVADINSLIPKRS